MAAYDAFVSYSHAKDKPIAAALQSVIQTLGKPWYRRRALRVFRDDTSLSATPELWPSIEAALGNSKFLILLASPEAAASPWVNKEVQSWLDNKSADTLLIALTDGELSWDNASGDFAAHERMPLPPVLAGRFASEPKWVDLRAYREGANARDARFIDAGADFAAAIHGMPKEDLLSQEVRQQRRALTLAWSAAGSLLILAGLAGWQWKVAIDNERAAIEQRIIAEQQQRIAQEQRDLAEAERKRAETERGRAEKNYAGARSTVDSLVTNIAGGLSNVEGLRGETIARILGAVRSTIDQLAKTNPEDVGLEAIRGRMYGEFGSTYWNSGDFARAREAGLERLKIARDLARREPEDVDRKRNATMASLFIGLLDHTAGDVTAAERAFREGVEAMRAIVARAPSNLWHRGDLAYALDRLGEVSGWSVTNSKAAEAAFSESVEIRRALVKSDPKYMNWRMWLGASLSRLASVKRDIGQLDAAAPLYDETLEHMRVLVAHDPDNTQWQRDLSVSLRNHGDLNQRRGRFEPAAKAFEESLVIERRLAKLDPANIIWRRGLAATLDQIGSLRRSGRDVIGAIAAWEEARGLYRRLVEADRQPREIAMLTDLLPKLRELAEGQKDTAGARSAYREWLAMLEKRAAEQPANADAPGSLLDPLVRLARLGDEPESRLKQARAIVDALKKRRGLGWTEQSLETTINVALAQLSSGGVVLAGAAAGHRRLAIRPQPNDPQAAQRPDDIGAAYARIGNLHAAAGRREEALAEHRRSLAARQAAVEAEPSNTQALDALRATHLAIGDMLSAAGQWEAALESYRQSQTVAVKIYVGDISNVQSQRNRALSQERMGDMLLNAKLTVQALGEYRQALAMREKIAAADPANAQWQRELSIAHAKIGMAQEARGNVEDALWAYQWSLSIREKLAAAEPNDTQRQLDLAVSLYDVSMASDAAQARPSLHRALAIAEKLAKADGLTDAERTWPQVLRDMLARLPPEQAKAQ